MLRFVALIVLFLLSSACATTVGTLHTFRPADRPKTILVAVDGTGNSAISRTNTARLYEAFEASGAGFEAPLATHYSEGVGSRGSPLGLMAGAGMNSDVRQAYDFLSRTYRPNDTLIFTGFSRGAYAVRILAGLLAVGGIPNASHMHFANRERLIRELFAAYLTPADLCDLEGGSCPRRERMRAIYDRYGVKPFDLDQGVRIRAMAIWDTVEAMGAPDRTEDPTENLKRYMVGRCNVDFVFHALALHDNRATSFTPIFMDGPTMIRACPNEKFGKKSEVYETWFSGAHADVGGSYDWKRMIDGALPTVSYNWMIDWLKKKLGAELKRVNALALAYEDVDSPIHDAREALLAYKILDRNFRAPLAYQSLAKIPSAPRIHISAVERLLVVDAIDGSTPRCPRGSAPESGRKLLCSAEIGATGLVAEMLAPGRDCLSRTKAGWQLKPGQTCIVIECRDQTLSNYYCGNEREYAVCRNLDLAAAPSGPAPPKQGNAVCPNPDVQTELRRFLSTTAPVSL